MSSSTFVLFVVVASGLGLALRVAELFSEGNAPEDWAIRYAFDTVMQVVLFVWGITYLCLARP